MIVRIRSVLVLFLLLAAVVLSGCASDDGKIRVDIETDIEKYSPVMSSAIGFNLTAKFTPLQKGEFTYHWSTNCGQFLNFDQNGSEQVTDVVTENGRVLWTPTYDNPEDAIYDVTLVIQDEKGVEIASGIIEFVRDENLFFTPKK